MAENRRRGRGSSVAKRLALVLVASGLALTACTSSSNPDVGGSIGSTTVLPSKPSTGAPISVGYISPEGGATGQVPEAREAAQAAVQYINSNLGGVQGRPVNLVVCKEKEDPATARDCANQLVAANVVAVVAPVTSQGDAMVPIITGAGIPFVTGLGASSTEMTSNGAFVLSAGVPGGLAVVAKYAVQQKYKKVALVGVDAGAVMAGLKVIAGPVFQQSGVQLQTIGIPIGTPDATPQISAALEGNPDAITILGDGPLCTSVLKALQTLGSKADKLLFQLCVSPDVISAVGTAAAGAHVLGYSDVTSEDAEAVLYRTVMSKYAPNTAVGGTAYMGYQTTLGLYRSIAGLQGDVTAAAAMGAMNQATNVDLPVGHGLTFTCGGKTQPLLKAICGSGAIITTLKDGKPVDPQVFK
ncbi:MAG: hypothetical protein JWN03_3202 [Nocardia sp.]|nr:hypothetical protein [Nocardia sp.]